MPVTLDKGNEDSGNEIEIRGLTRVTKGPVPVVLPALQLSGYGGYTYCTVSRELQRIRRDVLHWLTNEKYKVQKVTTI